MYTTYVFLKFLQPRVQFYKRLYKSPPWDFKTPQSLHDFVRNKCNDPNHVCVCVCLTEGLLGMSAHGIWVPATKKLIREWINIGSNGRMGQ